MSKNKLALAVFSLATLVSTSSFAQEATAAAASNQFDAKGLAAIAAGFAIGIAVLGGTLGQSRAAAAALEGIGRNPGAAGKMLLPMILGLALIESLVLFALVVALNLTPTI